jgi:hypothetical protein
LTAQPTKTKALKLIVIISNTLIILFILFSDEIHVSLTF